MITTRAVLIEVTKIIKKGACRSPMMAIYDAEAKLRGINVEDITEFETDAMSLFDQHMFQYADQFYKGDVSKLRDIDRFHIFGFTLAAAVKRPDLHA